MAYGLAEAGSEREPRHYRRRGRQRQKRGWTAGGRDERPTLSRQPSLRTRPERRHKQELGGFGVDQFPARHRRRGQVRETDVRRLGREREREVQEGGRAGL